MSENTPERFSDVVCDSDYVRDKIGQKLNFAPLPDDLAEPCNQEALQHVKITNLRIRFTKFSQKAKSQAINCEKVCQRLLLFEKQNVVSIDIYFGIEIPDPD